MFFKKVESGVKDVSKGMYVFVYAGNERAECDLVDLSMMGHNRTLSVIFLVNQIF